MPTKILHVRLDDALLANLAILLKRAETEHPGECTTVSAVVRAAVLHAANCSTPKAQERPFITRLLALDKSSPGE